MHSALVTGNQIVSAEAYDESIHGVEIRCMDQKCKVPVFFVRGTASLNAHFKTSGKGASVHKDFCGFAKPLSFQDTVSKVGEYQESILENNTRQIVIRLSMNDIDPDYEKKTIERNPLDKEKKKPEPVEESLKVSKVTPSSISSLKAVKKLFTTVSPDILAGIMLSVKGQKIPISNLIQSYSEAHEALWSGKAEEVPYFVHGCIERVVRRDRVWYISLSKTDKGYFSLIVFDRHFNHFTYKDSELIGQEVLAYGYLQKNDYHKDKKSTEMVIKSNQYIEFL